MKGISISSSPTQQRTVRVEGLKKQGITHLKGICPTVQLVLKQRLGILRRLPIRAKRFQGLKSEVNHKREN